MHNTPAGSPHGLEKKVLFTGLDYSGKSTILQALQDKFTRIQTLKPTAGVQRTVFHFLDAKIMHYDLGGQKKYLIRYLRQPGKIFDDTDVVIYVVDIHDYARYDEAISYFKDLIALLVRLAILPAIHVFLHKAENILLANDIEGTRFIDYLTEQFESVNDGRFTMAFHVTTIYNTWSLTSAFSDIMRGLYPVSTIVSKIIDGLVHDLYIDGAALFDSHLIMLSSSFPGNSPVAKQSTPLLYLLQHALRVCQMNPSIMRLAFDDWEIAFIDLEASNRDLKLFLFGHEERMSKVDPAVISHLVPDLFEALDVSKEIPTPIHANDPSRTRDPQEIER